MAFKGNINIIAKQPCSAVHGTAQHDGSLKLRSFQCVLPRFFLRVLLAAENLAAVVWRLCEKQVCIRGSARTTFS